MRCPKCETDNREGRRFCGDCGAPLAQACPACGFSNEPGESFCGGCGISVASPAGGRAASPAAPAAIVDEAPPIPVAAAEPDSRENVPDAERRQLTIMFCDLVGSTALSERLDPEDLREVMNAYHGCCARAIEQFDGFVARYVGDGVLAYFGYPRAHEDDAERAVRAALGVVEAVSRLAPRPGLTIAVRVGIATGLVVAGEIIGKGASEERAVVGETPNLAARLQGLAEPGSVIISSSTHQLVGGLFEYEALNDLNLKGLSDPIQAWRVTGQSAAESRFEAAAIRGLTPLIGREEEIGLLLRRWELAREGDGQVVMLSGEAGVGKSRILRGFQERIKGELRNRILYFCSPYHQNTALQPSVEQFGRALRFQKDDTTAQKLDKLDQALTELSLPLREFAPVLASLLSLTTAGRYPPLALPPGEAMTKTLEALVTIVEKMASQDPVLMIVEDVHCVDASTRELLNHLVERVAHIPILLVITYRLEFESPWSGHGQVTVITLNRLSRRETAEMILEVSGGKALPEELVEQLVKKTDGVALYVEELTKTVIESDLLDDAGGRYILNGPLPALAVPASLQDSLMARLDRLAPVKEVAQLAATIGRHFSQDLLMAVSELERSELDDALAQLVDAELVYRHGMAPDLSYEFKHALVQDAAYASLLRSTRQQYHRRIAQALEKSFAKTAQTEPALLAHHYTEAGLPRQAIGYWLKAGALLHDQGSVNMSMNTYRKALEFAEDGESRCRALIGIAEGMRVTDEYDAALQALDEAQELAGAQQLDGELARIHHLRGNLYFPLGNVTGCLEEHEQALLYAQKTGDTENEARALSGLGDAHYSRGRMRTSLGHFRRCIELSKQHDYLHIAVGNQYMVAWTRFYMNEVRGALSDALEAVDSAVEIGYLRAEMVARLTAARALVELAELDAATEHVERGLSIADTLGANRFKPFLMIFRARVQLARNGYRAETVELMRSAAEISRETSEGFLGPWVLSIFALSCDDPDEGSQALREGEEILRGGCVGHNYFAFYRTAVEASLQWQDWGGADRYASTLEDYCRPEPLPRCDYYIARGRALAEFGRDGRSDELVTRLTALRQQANEIGLLAAVPALDAALGDTRIAR